uniref:RING-type domain-containing protein n=1 Tax=Peronospora matthiolae TaxID=2874970 RepID=A0AAV1VFX0_9STRA
MEAPNDLDRRPQALDAAPDTEGRRLLPIQDVDAVEEPRGRAGRSASHDSGRAQAGMTLGGRCIRWEENALAASDTNYYLQSETGRDGAGEADDEDDAEADDGNGDEDGGDVIERLDIEEGEEEDGEEEDGEEERQESDEQTAVDELQALCRRCYHSLPFVALFVVYIAYEHATGILVFVIGTVAIMGLDHRIREQVAMKDKASGWHLLSIVTMCAIDMAVICFLDGEPNPLHHFSQILQSTGRTHGSDSGGNLVSNGVIFWQVLWTVIVNDFLVRFWSIIAKALVAGAKSGRFQCEKKYGNEATAIANVSRAVAIEDEATDGTTDETPLTRHAVSAVSFNRRKRKLYGIIEMCSIFLRSLLASIPWCSFYQLCGSKFMADVFTFAYLLIKGVVLATHGRRIFVLARSLIRLGLEFGVYVSSDDLVEAGSPDCSICYEPMNQPVKLACSHMFCEECVTEWFDHERSCPLCRASVGTSNSTEAENVKPQFLDGRTSLVPQVL